MFNKRGEKGKGATASRTYVCVLCICRIQGICLTCNGVTFSGWRLFFLLFSVCQTLSRRPRRAPTHRAKCRLSPPPYPHPHHHSLSLSHPLGCGTTNNNTNLKCIYSHGCLFICIRNKNIKRITSPLPALFPIPSSPTIVLQTTVEPSLSSTPERDDT